MKNLSKKLLILGMIALVLGSCVKQEFDEPEVQNIPEGTSITIAELRQMVTDSINNVPGATKYTFKEDYSLYATVTMDEARAGNLYKSVYLQDGTGAINLQLLYSGSLYEGDSIRLYLKDLSLVEYNGAVQIDSVDIEKDVVKIATNVATEPVSVTIADLETGMYEATLVKLEDVQFINGDLGKTWAEFEENTNRTLEDCDGRQILVRTSGWSNFYGDTLPSGKGSVVAVASIYGSDLQIYVRSVEEVSMDSSRCGGTGGTTILSKDFSDSDIHSGGWTEQFVTGSVAWEIYGTSNPAGSISNYSGGGNTACETWYISPAVDLSATTNPALSFRNCSGYSGPDIELYVSTDYDGTSLPATATWTQLSFTLAVPDPFWSWTDSGAVDLSSYISGSTYIAFKYTGTSSTGKTWEIDDILISE